MNSERRQSIVLSFVTGYEDSVVKDLCPVSEDQALSVQ